MYNLERIKWRLSKVQEQVRNGSKCNWSKYECLWTVCMVMRVIKRRRERDFEREGEDWIFKRMANSTSMASLAPVQSDWKLHDNAPRSFPRLRATLDWNCYKMMLCISGAGWAMIKGCGKELPLGSRDERVSAPGDSKPLHQHRELLEASKRVPLSQKRHHRHAVGRFLNLEFEYHCRCRKGVELTSSASCVERLAGMPALNLS